MNIFTFQMFFFYFLQIFLLYYPFSYVIFFLWIFHHFNNTFVALKFPFFLFQKEPQWKYSFLAFLHYPSHHNIFKLYFHFNYCEFVVGKIDVPTYLLHCNIANPQTFWRSIYPFIFYVISTKLQYLCPKTSFVTGL